MRARTILQLSAIALAGAASFIGVSRASTPPSGSVTVPANEGATIIHEWKGSVVTGVNLASDCTAPLGISPVDEHTIEIQASGGDPYAKISATFTFSIEWKFFVLDATSDLILTLVGPDGVAIDSSDGGSPQETIIRADLAPGTYRVLACGFLNALPTAYDGKLVVQTTAKTTDDDLPSAPSHGLAFSAAIAADPQRDEAEPMIEISKDGLLVTCGPSGFSTLFDYAQGSLDDGDQFHLFGTPPRGQQAVGGGGDCGIAHAVERNAAGHYQYAYTGLGPLTGFSTATSPNQGRNLVSGGPVGNGVTDKGAGADRQWLTFVDASTVLLLYAQLAPRNAVVQRSSDGGLTYSPITSIAAPSPGRIGPVRYNEKTKTAFFAYSGTTAAGPSVNLSISRNAGVTWTTCVAAQTTSSPVGFVVADSDLDGNIYVTWTAKPSLHTYVAALPADRVGACATPISAGRPTENAGFLAPVQVDRDRVRTSVFPWLTAGGAAGRVAVTFYGTETDGDPDSGDFKGSWDVYVSQSLNANTPDANYAQVKATTHPMHYDSICSAGLGCNISGGDRSLLDFFGMAYNPVSGRLHVTYNRAEKRPDDPEGLVTTTMVLSQIGGPSNGGGKVAVNRPVVRSASVDPAGDALSSFSTLGPPGAPPPATTNEPAADFLSVDIGPEVDLATGERVKKGGFTLTMRVADLSDDALAETMGRTGSKSLLWVFRFVNGYQSAAVSARYSAVDGFTFGYNDYTVAGASCMGPVGPKCVIFPGNVPVAGVVDQAAGTFRIAVPIALLRRLEGPTGPEQRPLEVAAEPGSRLYDAAAYSMGNTLSATQDVQSFLYPFDNTPAMDFDIPRGAADPGPNRDAGPADDGGSGSDAGNGGRGNGERRLAGGGASCAIVGAGGGSADWALGLWLATLGLAVLMRRRGGRA